jgi:hypothetical protein
MPNRPAGAEPAGGLDNDARISHADLSRMNFDLYAQSVIAFVRDNAAWAPPIVFALAFGESLAFISLLIPAWGALVAIGALIGPSGINFWPVWIGAAFGDWLSYWIGLKLEYSVAHIWPLSKKIRGQPRSCSDARRTLRHSFDCDVTFRRSGSNTGSLRERRGPSRSGRCADVRNRRRRHGPVRQPRDLNRHTLHNRNPPGFSSRGTLKSVYPADSILALSRLAPDLLCRSCPVCPRQGSCPSTLPTLPGHRSPPADRATLRSARKH